MGEGVPHPWVESMSFFDLFRQEYVRGKVFDKYTLSDGNLGLVVEREDNHRRYHVEFKDGYKGPSLDNLYGLLKEPFGSKTEYLDRLINKNDVVELTVSYSKGPLRQAYRIHSVSGPADYKTPRDLVKLPYRPDRIAYSSAKTATY
jgi:hypothetical protein